MSLVQAPMVDREAVLRSLGIDERTPDGQALLLICARYGLDPVMKHVVLITRKPYITRDGYLHVAHQSGQLDGIEVVSEGESDTHWLAKVAVYRKDMGRPFAYSGRYPKAGQQKAYGPEMAVKTAECMALRRAFDVAGMAALDEAWDTPDVERATVERPARDGLRAALAELDPEAKTEVRTWCELGGIPRVVGLMSMEQVAQVQAHLDRLEFFEAAVLEIDAADEVEADDSAEDGLPFAAPARLVDLDTGGRT